MSGSTARTRWSRFPGNAICALVGFALAWAVAASLLALIGGRDAVREWGVHGAIVLVAAGISVWSALEARRTGERVHALLGFCFFTSLFELATHLLDVIHLRPVGIFWLAAFLLVFARVRALDRASVEA